MQELLDKYQDLKSEAVDLMAEGKINAYVEKLSEASDLKLEIVKLRSQ
jgi:hypothetical protein